MEKIILKGAYKMFEIGQEVFCYYDEIVPLIEGKVVESEYKNLTDYIKVKHNMGGTSHFCKHLVFATREEWENYYNKLEKEKLNENI
jgi:hypothetical protein